MQRWGFGHTPCDKNIWLFPVTVQSLAKTSVVVPDYQFQFMTVNHIYFDCNMAEFWLHPHEVLNISVPEIWTDIKSDLQDLQY